MASIYPKETKKEDADNFNLLQTWLLTSRREGQRVVQPDVLNPRVHDMLKVSNVVCVFPTILPNAPLGTDTPFDRFRVRMLQGLERWVDCDNLDNKPNVLTLAPLDNGYNEESGPTHRVKLFSALINPTHLLIIEQEPDSFEIAMSGIAFRPDPYTHGKCGYIWRHLPPIDLYHITGSRKCSLISVFQSTSGHTVFIVRVDKRRGTEYETVHMRMMDDRMVWDSQVMDFYHKPNDGGWRVVELKKEGFVLLFGGSETRCHMYNITKNHPMSIRIDTAHVRHVPVGLLLPDGDVLITGGYTTVNPDASTFVYDTEILGMSGNLEPGNRITGQDITAVMPDTEYGRRMQWFGNPKLVLVDDFTVLFMYPSANRMYLLKRNINRRWVDATWTTVSGVTAPAAGLHVLTANPSLLIATPI